MTLRYLAIFFAAIAFSGCSDDASNSTTNNGSGIDQGQSDTGTSDDTGESDIGLTDAGNSDLGAPDASEDAANDSGGDTGTEDRVCGNGIVETGELCDANQIGGETCESQGFAGGELGCASNCQTFDTSSCTAAPTCGDGLLNGTEICDGTDVGGNTCELLGRTAGTLRCATNCGAFDLASCGPADTCDGVAIDGNEVCDGTLIGTATCESLGFGPGTLVCGTDCQAYDTSGCSAAPRCGDGAINGTETCDGALLSNQTCETQGFGAGTLGCAADCRSYDTDLCPPAPTCGDGVLNGTEVCDGALLDSETCETQGFGPGVLTCAANCAAFITTACPPAPSCGDGIINGTEVCDGTALAGQTCGTQSAGIGTLSCKADCTGYNTTNCCQPDCSMTQCGPDPVCGTACGTCGIGESCAAGQCVCVPETCTSLGAACGAMPDGCGGTLFCGGCTNGESCNNGSCGCGIAADGMTYTVNVPVVDIIFNVTLNGQPVTSANTNDSDEGVLILQDSDTGERIQLPDTANGNTMGYPTTRRIIPGYYDIYYANGGTLTNWPINNSRRLIERADLNSPQTIVIDVQTVDITFEVTLNGQPVTAANTNDSDEGIFILVDPTTNERIQLPDTANGTTMGYPATRRLLPGTYDIYYANGGTLTNWPINDNHVLIEGANLGSSQTYAINVQTVDLTFDVTLNGQPVTSANTNDSDEGVFILADPTTGERIQLPDTANGTTMGYPTTRRILPANYDIYYANGGTVTNWPINNNHLLSKNVPMVTTRTHVINVPSTDITFEATLNGQPVTSANTNDSDEGVFILQDKTTGERIQLPDTANGSTMGYPATRRLIPAIYDIYYSNGGTISNWPINNNHVLYEDASLISVSTFVINTPTIDATFDVTLAGQPVTSANTNDSDEGILILQDPTTGERIQLPDTANGNTMGYPATRRLIPSVYDVYYANGGTLTNWPINNNHVLQSNTSFMSSQTYVIDVPVVDLTFDVLLNGQAVTSANTNDSDEGILILQDPMTGERIQLPDTANGTTMGYPVTLRIIGSDYDIYYANGGTVTNWPINNNKKLGCFGF